MRLSKVTALTVLAVAFAARPIEAYHLFYVMNGGTPVPARWQTIGIAFLADTDGPTGQSFTTLCTTATNTWNNVADALNVFATPTTSTINFTSANIFTAWGNLTGDGQQELVYDADGSALTALGLSPATINAYGPSRLRAVGGQGVIDDAFLVVTGTRSNFDLLSTLVHELGHILGIAHSSVGMHNSESPDDALDKIAINSVPTMHPFSLGAGDTARRTLEPDDNAAMRELYPEPGAVSRWAHVAGEVRRCGSDDPVAGANVRLVNTANANIQISRFSAFDGNASGRYVMNYVPAGTYRVVVEPLGANGFSLDRFGGLPSAAENDFDFEYRSPSAVEIPCVEEMPEPAADIANVTATNGVTGIGNDVRVEGPELAFVIDDTGSMSEEIAAVRQALDNTIARLEAASVDRPFPLTAVVTFKDDVTKRIVSNNPTNLKSVVDSLFADGGDDCPEASNAGLLVAGRMLRKNGTVMLFTDADARADGPARSAILELYLPKFIRISVLLSGTCSGQLTSALTFEPGAIGVPTAAPVNARVDSRGRSNADEYLPPPVNGDESAVTTFSNIANATGGFFVAIPGINTDSADETARYTNTATNLSISAVLPAIALFTPTNAPRATTLSVEIFGSHTNFINGQSTLSVAGDGIAVNSISVTSPTRLTANISVNAAAALGFRDAVVTTNLGGATVEQATGLGVVNVVPAPAVATTLSATPSQGSMGQTLDVLISAGTVSFTSDSVANFGSGIVVLNSQLVTPTTLVARIEISTGATVGYRRISIFTPGTQTAVDNSPAGVFQVVAPLPVVPIIQSISPNRVEAGTTVNVSVTGVNTAFSPTTTLTFSGAGIVVNSMQVSSPTFLEANINVASNAVLGFRDVVATTAGHAASILNGLQVSAASTPTCATDVTSAVRVTRSGFRFNGTAQAFIQTVTLTNVGSAPVVGPVSLVAQGLSANASIARPNGLTTCGSTASPYLNANVGVDNVLSPGESTVLTLQFVNPTNQGITYAPQVLAGPGIR